MSESENQGDNGHTNVDPSWHAQNELSTTVDIHVLPELSQDQVPTQQPEDGGQAPSPKAKSLEERIGQLSPQQAPPTVTPQPFTMQQVNQQPNGQPKFDAISGFPMEDAVMRAPRMSGYAKDHLWIEGGSLRPMPGEEVLGRYGGLVTDPFQFYFLCFYLMITNRRITIKTIRTLFGMNMFTIEESFLYSNLKHVSVRRVTNFRYLMISIGCLFFAITFFSVAAYVWVYALIGVIVFLSGLLSIYWFYIFYNTNTLVLDFAKPEAVGSWMSVISKGTHTLKAVFLPISTCFDVMYQLYDHAKTEFAQESV